VRSAPAAHLGYHRTATTDARAQRRLKTTLLPGSYKCSRDCARRLPFEDGVTENYLAHVLDLTAVVAMAERVHA
jgi:hypothetical protein